MKTTVLLLLLTVGAWGQEINTPHGGRVEFRLITPREAEEQSVNPIYRTFSVDSVDWLHPRVQSMVGVLVTAWDLYSKECYADSTAVVRFPFRVGTSEWERQHYPPKELQRIEAERRWAAEAIVRVTYTHRTPTYPGFIEYLRRQR
jgi:hypothetical protein